MNKRMFAMGMFGLLLAFVLLILVGCPLEDDSLDTPEIYYEENKNGGVTIGWSAVKNAESYVLECTYVRGLPLEELYEGGGNAATSSTFFRFDSRWLVAGATYSFKMKACRQTGGLKYSEWSNILTIKIKN
jgi:hypothetical protein